MKFINTCRKYGAKLAVVTAAPLALAAQANAALPETAKKRFGSRKSGRYGSRLDCSGRFRRAFVFSIVKRVMK
ncbi:phage associated protein [Neisseria gonorrhoeae]|nr:phage associated protein [Neisseria gonorrhoeae]